MPKNIFTGEELPPAGQELSAPTGNPEEGYSINPHRQAGFLERLLAGFSATGEQAANVSGNIHGADNVVVTGDGRTFIKDPETRQFYPQKDPKAFDVAGMIGSAAPYVAASLAAPEVTLPGAAGSAGIRIGQAALNSAIQGGLGGAARIAGGAIASGGTLPSPGEAAGVVERDALAGGAMGGALHAGVEAIDALRPHNIIARYLTNRYAEGANRAAARGEPPLAEQAAVVGPAGLTPGQETGSKGLLTVEGMLRRNPATADILERMDRGQLQAGKDTLFAFLDKLHQGATDPVSVGVDAKNAFDKYLTGITDARRIQAKTDFGFIDTLVGRAPVIAPSNTLAAIEEEMRRAQTPGSGSAAAAIGRDLGKMHDDLAGGRLSGQQFQNLLSQYGDAAAGKGSVFQNIDSASNRRISGRLFGALQQDLDTAAQNPNIPGDVARALTKARDNYRANTAPLDELRQSAVGHLLGDSQRSLAPEDVAASLARQPGTHLAASLGILERADPAFSGLVQRHLVEDAFNRAQPPAEQINNALAGGNPAPDWSPGRLFGNLKSSPVWDTFDPNQRYEANVIFSGLGRIAKREGEGSPTTPLAMASQMVKSLGGAMAHPIAAAQFLTTLLTARGLAHAITTPEGRRTLMTLTATNPGTERAARAAGWLADVAGQDQGQAATTPPDPAFQDAAFRDAVGKLGR